MTNGSAACVLTIDSELDRIATLCKSDENRTDLIWDPFVQSYPTLYEALYQNKPITCATTGTIFEGIPAPRAVVMDVRISFFNNTSESEPAYH